ncbi:PAS domain-containing protein [Pedobacter insulae]|uniref:histidine kinase n=1 Tax=Pedobacter insulae TaxID=414048 RepID=A0A1I2X3F1_9SPHI|nr:PAS domain-containing protein [Pedobacter insulae]SFH06461.1 PAS domain S-box-containing protein [Pedobacter insulae]
MDIKSEHLYALLQSIEGVVWEADIDMQRFSFISDHVEQITGFSKTEWLNQPGFWETRIHPEDFEVVTKYYDLRNRKIKGCTFEYRMIRADGEIIWVKDNVSSLRLDNGDHIFRGIIIDNTTTERLRALERLEYNILRLSSDFRLPLEDVLLNYLKGLEALFPQMQCSNHQIKNGRVASGLSPSLPAAYISKVIGLQIGENEGSCGTAAATGQQVIVSDIATDKRWFKYRSLALDYQLGACWSNPIINTEGEVIATLAMYYQNPRIPSENELQVMQKATALLRIIIENRQKTEVINEANLLMSQSQELAHFGNWRWDIKQDIVNWSPAMYLIYGLDKKEFKVSSTGYLTMLHPDDLVRVKKVMERVLLNQEEIEFEERIVRPNGELRYLRSWAKLKMDAQGAPLEMIGACLDITEKVIQMQAIEQQNRQLFEIAWMQSHAIRSPLTKIMALVDLLKLIPESNPEKIELLKYLAAAASELDEQIKSINEKAKQAT